MNVAEWILVIMLAVALFIFLVAGIVLVIKLISLANEAKKIVMTGQGIAAKADDIVDNVKGMTSVGGIVKTFTNHVVNNQERRYAAEAAAEEAAEEATDNASRANAAAMAADASAADARTAASSAKTSARQARSSARTAKKSAK